jgi:2'-hydroxyisoflavone reductase
MKILVLGGTNFIGRLFIERIRDNANYDITLCNRGKTNAGLFDGLKHISLERNEGDLSVITNTVWDRVVDFSGYYPVPFEKLIDAISKNVHRYIFISTVSVYDLDKYANLTVTEKFETLACSPEQKVSKLPDAYGEKKAEMERYLLANEDMDTMVLRPSLIYGQYDPTDRLYYWLNRVNNDDDIILPGGGEKLTSLTYGPDLAAIVEEALHINDHNSIYNLVTHPPVQLKEIPAKAAEVLGKSPNYAAVPSEKLIEKGLNHWTDLPLWLDADFIVDYHKLKEDFSTELTSFDEAMKQTIAYYQSINWPEGKAGISAEKAREVIV